MECVWDGITAWKYFTNWVWGSASSHFASGRVHTDTDCVDLRLWQKPSVSWFILESLERSSLRSYLITCWHISCKTSQMLLTHLQIFLVCSQTPAWLVIYPTMNNKVNICLSRQVLQHMMQLRDRPCYPWRATNLSMFFLRTHISCL